MPKSRTRKNHKQKLAAYRQNMAHAKHRWFKMLNASPEPVAIVTNPSMLTLTDSENNPIPNE
jgi:hypothetical protein